MKRTFFYHTAICFALHFLFCGCEQYITNAVLTFEEKIVIQGVLQANKPIQNIAISKTIPPLGNLTSADLLLSNARITLTVDNKIYEPTMRFDSAIYQYGSSAQSISLPMYNFESVVAQAGKTYNLTVSWQGKTAFCATTIPDTSLLKFTNGYAYSWTPQIIISSSPGGRSVTVGTVLTLEAHVQTQPEYCYKLTFYAKEANSALDTNNSNIFFTGDETEWFILPKGIHQTTQSILRAIGSTSRFPNLMIDFAQQAESLARITQRVRNAQYTAVLTAAPVDYYLWYNSRFEGGSSPDPFSVGGQNIYSNIMGDGVGLFSSASSVEIPLRVQ